MIFQQYYTRYNRGVFTKLSGFSTVAVSEGLEKNFIKKVEKYCFYESSAEDKDQGYDPIFINVPIEDKLVCLRSVYLEYDNLKVKNNFFTHAYIIQGEDLESALKDIVSVAYTGRFRDRYDEKEGNRLPLREALAIDNEMYTEATLDDILKECKVPKDSFISIINSVYDSVVNRKRTYISLDVPRNKINYYAKALMKYIYLYIPLEARRKLGYISYLKSFKSIHGINVYFIDRDILLGQKLLRCHYYDFCNNSFSRETGVEGCKEKGTLK